MNNKRSARRRAGGFSLLELLLVLTVAGVLAGVAIPAFDRIVQDSRRTTVVNDLLASVVLARSEAIKRRQTVVVCGFDDANGNGRLDDPERACAGSDWSDGWIVATWADANGNGRAEAAEFADVRHVAVAVEAIRIHAGAFTAGVQPTGTAVMRPMSQHSSNGTVVVCDRRGAEHARAVILSPSGRSRTSSRRADGGPLVCPPN